MLRKIWHFIDFHDLDTLALLIGAAYVLGLIGLTFFQVHTGLYLTNFWTYFPVLPFVAAIFETYIYGTGEAWLNGKKKESGYRKGLLLLLSVIIWPMAVWHMLSNYHWLMVTRFVPCIVTFCVGMVGVAVQYWKKSKQPARSFSAAA